MTDQLAALARHRHVLFAALGYAVERQARPETALADQIHVVMS
jgi:hypothetical protein